MTVFTFHLTDGLADRTDTVPGDDIETLDDARQAVAQAGGEAMRSLGRNLNWGGTWKMEARDSAGKAVCELSIVVKLAQAMEAKATDADHPRGRRHDHGGKPQDCSRAEAEADTTKVEKAIRELRRLANLL